MSDEEDVVCFGSGDQVQLKSGGPTMTVDQIGHGAHYLICQWFAGKKLETGNFRPSSLKMIEEAED